MKCGKGKETFSIIVSVILALGLFLFLLAGLGWNLILCMVLGVAAYAAFTLILRPVKKIGKVDAESLDNGEYLSDRLAEAAGDYSRMRKAVEKIREESLKAECGGLLRLAENILKYLTDNPEKIPGARRYIDYYQETAANVLENYVELKETGLSTKETEKVLKNTRESVSTLTAAFKMQFEKWN